MVQWEKKVNTLKWIGPQRDLFLGYLFFFNTCFWHFTLSSGSIMVHSLFPLIYIMLTVLIRLWFISIPGFVSLNFLFKLIVHDKLSSLKMLFLSFSFFSSFSFYQSLFCVSVCLHGMGIVSMYVYGFFVFLLLLFFLQIIYDCWYTIKLTWLLFFLPRWLCVCVCACVIS